MADLTSNKQPDKQTPENGELEKSLESRWLEEQRAGGKGGRRFRLTNCLRPLRMILHALMR